MIYERCAKRTIDFVLALIGLVVAAIPMGIVAIAVSGWVGAR